MHTFTFDKSTFTKLAKQVLDTVASVIRPTNAKVSLKLDDLRLSEDFPKNPTKPRKLSVELDGKVIITYNSSDSGPVASSEEAVEELAATIESSIINNPIGNDNRISFGRTVSFNGGSQFEATADLYLEAIAQFEDGGYV